MPVDARPARPIGRACAGTASWLGALLLLAGLAACGGAERVTEPAEPLPSLSEPEPPAPTIQKPPSTFSRVVDESIRRKKVIERLKLILKESEP